MDFFIIVDECDTEWVRTLSFAFTRMIQWQMDAKLYQQVNQQLLCVIIRRTQMIMG